MSHQATYLLNRNEEIEALYGLSPSMKSPPNGFTLLKYSNVKHGCEKQFIPVEVLRIYDYCKGKIKSIEVGKNCFKLSTDNVDYWIGLKSTINAEVDLQERFTKFSKEIDKGKKASFVIHKKMFNALDRINIIILAL